MVELWGLGSRNREGSENQGVGDKLHQVLGGEKRQLIPRVPTSPWGLPANTSFGPCHDLSAPPSPTFAGSPFPVLITGYPRGPVSRHRSSKCQLRKLVTNRGLNIHFLYCLSR